MLPVAEIRVAARAETPASVALRRAVHRRPELARHEVETTRRVAASLKDAGIEPKLLPAGTGLVAEVGTDGPCVGFRADLDALPVDEASGEEFSSEIPGIMHACGHDVHTAVAVGIAKTLAALAPRGRYRFLFQPAEEQVPAGARDLIDFGALEGLEKLIAFHIDPERPAGVFGLREGPITSASDRIRIRLSGPGGHTSRPERAVDLIQTAAVIVNELPPALRTAAAPHNLVAVFGTIHAGSAENVMPADLSMAGTVRTVDMDTWRRMPPIVDGKVRALAQSRGAGVELEYTQGAPPVINDGPIIRSSATALQSLLGPGAIQETHRSMGAEDFAWYLQRIPGALIRLGAAPRGPAVDLHSAHFRIDEAAIEAGIAAGTAILMALAATG